jgi:glycine oxidase
MKNNDIIIIGNGVIGLSIAYSLSNINSSLKISVIGTNERKGSASVAAGAMLNCFAEITDRTFATEHGKIKFEMALQASKIWPNWVNEINQNLSNEEKIIITPGTYIILNNGSGTLDTNNYLGILKALKAYNEPYTEISNPYDIAGLNPIPNSRPLQSIYLEQEGSIDPDKLITALFKILSNRPNITMVNDNAKGITTNALKTQGITLNSGEKIFANTVILANGSFAQHLIDDLPELCTSIPKVLAGVGYSAILEQDPNNIVKNVIRTPNRAGACGLHALPRGKYLYVGATNNVFCQPQFEVTTGLAHFLLECTINQVNQNLYKSKIKNWHIGNRPATIDTFPLIGDTSIEGLWILTGTYRDGLHQSPLLAKHIANLILGKQGLFDQNLFRPERKVIRTLTKEESINEFVYHYIAGTYEHSAMLPKFMCVNDLENMIFAKINKIYDGLDTDYGLSPDMLLMFEFAANQDSLIREYRNYFKKCT